MFAVACKTCRNRRISEDRTTHALDVNYSHARALHAAGRLETVHRRYPVSHTYVSDTDTRPISDRYEYREYKAAFGLRS